MIIKLLLMCQLSVASWTSTLWNKAKTNFSKDKKENVSVLLQDEETPVDFEQPSIEITESNSRDWKAPDYSQSEGSLGYDKDTFSVPAELKIQVGFWQDIYTKYSSWQGVLHDSEHIDHIYATIDFSEIMKDSSLNVKQRRRKKKELVKSKKLEVKKRLIYLHSVKDPSLLSGEDLRIWNMYKNVDENDKFKKASKKGRLRFQLGQSDYFQQGIYSSGRYLEEMEKIFRSFGLPVELTRLPFVESSFNLRARSKVGASGIWQFMRSTGRLYMKVNGVADYRNNPIAATRAAAKKMKSNYKLTGAWPLAITGYNYGPSGIKRLSKELNTKSLVEIIKKEKSSRFGFASKNFYASYLAALNVERNANKFFKKPKWMKPLKMKEYRLQRRLSYKTLAKLYEEKGFDFQLYNPQFTRYAKRRNAQIGKGYRVYLPIENSLALEQALNVVKGPTYQSVEKNDSVIKYRVERGDTLIGIAMNFGVRVEAIMDENGLSSARIYAGQRLNIPSK